jgi:hypothetical protein
MYILAFAKDDERARIVDLILDFSAREFGEIAARDPGTA